MAIVVDKARNALMGELCATSAFEQPTPRAFLRGVQIKASVADAAIVGDTAPVGVADSEYPTVVFDAFWLPKVVKTHRFT